MVFYRDGDRDPWDRRVVYDERAEVWAHTYDPIHIVSAPVDGGDECVVYNPDPETYLDEWAKTDIWFDLCDWQ